MDNIEYVAILRGHTIIASYGDSSATSDRELIKLLPATPATEQKITNGKVFTYVPAPSLSFVCVSPQSVDKQRPLQFLGVLSRRWLSTYAPVSASATAHALDSFFAKDFAGLFAEFNQAKTADLARELEETQRILTQSISRAYERDSDLHNLSSKSENLISTSEEFRRKSTALRKKMQCQWLKSWAWTIVIVLFIIYFIISRFCGGFLLGSCL
jgi:vesicle-associated membrane protein 7